MKQKIKRAAMKMFQGALTRSFEHVLRACMLGQFSIQIIFVLQFIFVLAHAAPAFIRCSWYSSLRISILHIRGRRSLC